MITGVTRNYGAALDDVRTALDPLAERSVLGISMLLTPDGRTIFIADTNVHDMPSAEEIAAIAVESARVARRLGYEPRVAFWPIHFRLPDGRARAANAPRGGAA